MKSVPENIYLKPHSTGFLGTQNASFLHPELPSGRVEGQQLQQHRVQSLQRQMANALGKCHFVVDTEIKETEWREYLRT